MGSIQCDDDYRVGARSKDVFVHVALQHCRRTSLLLPFISPVATTASTDEVLQETSSFIGPFVTSAIVERAGGNTYAAFYFLFPLALISLGIVCCIRPAKAKIDVARCMSLFLLLDIFVNAYDYIWEEGVLIRCVDLEKEARSLYGQSANTNEKELEGRQ